MRYFFIAFFSALVIWFLWEEYQQVKKNNVVRRLIEKYVPKDRQDKKMPEDTDVTELIDEMYDFASHDRKLGPIVKKYGATRDDFDVLFHRLLYLGNFRKINRFVPINSFFYVNSLTTLLRDGDKLDDHALTHKMFDYFHI
ncbi:MAG: hypothetical protein IIV92_00795 [Schwartzia sp.]|nr:hypothetical protein [Schwartzia sp. (in: firmicutes)]